jgi:hypothetical protein
MYSGTTMKHWIHHLHDGMLTMGHHISEHLHSRHFWAGVGITLLIIGFATLLFIAAKNAPFEMQGFYPYGTPYIP